MYKYSKNQWNKINQQFNDWYKTANDAARYPSNPCIKVEHTSLFPIHVAHRGLNHDQSKLLDFNTMLYEANNILFAGSAQEYFVTLFIDSTVYNRETAGLYLEVRKDGKTQDITLFDSYSDEEYKRQLDRLDKLNYGELFKFGRFDTFQPYVQHDLKQRLEKDGYKVLQFFRFTHSIQRIKPNYVKLSKNSIELGWTASGTYNSLPHVLKVSRAKGMPTVRLVDLGIESKGYYSHDSKCYIPKDKAKQAKAFFSRRFKRTA